MQPCYREKLLEELEARETVQSLFQLAVELGIPYPKAHMHIRRLERAGIITVNRNACRPMTIRLLKRERRNARD